MRVGQVGSNNESGRFLDEDDFKYLRFDWISEAPQLTSIATALGERWKDTNSPKRRSKRDMATAFNVVLTAIEVCSGYTRDWLRIPTYDAIYGGVTQRSPAFNRDVLDALKWLIAQGHLRETDGRRILKQKNREQLHLPKAYELTERWRSDIASAPISSPNSIRRNPLSSYIQVRETRWKNKKKHKVQVHPSPAKRLKHQSLIKATEKLLPAYDKLMSKTEIRLGDERIPSYQMTLTRIFSNGCYEDGGRYYGTMQGWTKADRRSLTFDGQKVVEIDYKSIHPTILYELEGLDPLKRPYYVEGYDRDAVKTAFNLLLNRTDQVGRTEACSIAYHLEIDVHTALKLRDALYQLHEPIKHRFNTGYGLRLQRIDSDIMSDVMSLFIRLNKPIIPIHDSAIVKVEDACTLMIAMRDAYVDHLQIKVPQTAVSKVFDVDDGVYVYEPFIPSGNGVGIEAMNLDEELEDHLVDLLSDRITVL